MTSILTRLAVWSLVVVLANVCWGEDAAALLAETDAKIAAQPDDPLLHYRRAQYLARLGKHDACYAAAKVAMDKFIAAKTDLAWIMLETLEVKGHQVSVHFNMGDDERQPPEIGIARPLSFRIYEKDGSAIREVIDFEIGYFGGKPSTAAFGQTTAEGHANLGIADPALPYSKIRTAAIALMDERLTDPK